MTRSAFVLVDIQNDFIPGGALPARDGDEVIPVANRLLTQFELIVASQDWHPQDHLSFASNHPGKSPGEMIELGGIAQVLWPDHCVQGSRGAELHSDLEIERIDHVVHKGVDRHIDSYSCFFDNGHLKATGLESYLRGAGVTHVFIGGLATDYCVLYSALDSVRLGFETTVITDACRGVELSPGDSDRAFEEMRRAGVKLVTSEDV